MRPLQRPAQYWLAAEFDAPIFTGRGPILDVNTVPLEGPEGLLAALERVPDPRHRRGIRHRHTTVLAVAVCAVLSGSRSFLAIAD